MEKYPNRYLKNAFFPSTWEHLLLVVRICPLLLNKAY